ncbi:hypothetical protein H5410_021102 [Solanum commersonii]|uniref:Ubiquitin-like protease family profile domain-containing protein n=1 Tax=Solanum commersonii TaxID=4109 RepID=A0A9J5ZBR0_SOLCO|nr:hypothetical protein H5410_021102 [Solanum commersonii]
MCASVSSSRYLQKTKPHADVDEYHFFNTYFYQKLKEAVLSKTIGGGAWGTMACSSVKSFYEKPLVREENVFPCNATRIPKMPWKVGTLYQDRQAGKNLILKIISTCPLTRLKVSDSHLPDKEDQLGPILLHLDSLGLHCSKSLFATIRNYILFLICHNYTVVMIIMHMPESLASGVVQWFGLGTSMLEVSSLKPLASLSNQFAFWKWELYQADQFA